MLIAGSIGAALAYVGMGFGKSASLTLGVIAPMALLGLSFAVLVAPLTASVLSSLETSDEGLASGVNNAVSRIAQLVGIAVAAGVASYSLGYELGFAIGAVTSFAAAVTIAARVPPAAVKTGASRRT